MAKVRLGAKLRIEKMVARPPGRVSITKHRIVHVFFACTHSVCTLLLLGCGDAKVSTTGADVPPVDAALSITLAQASESSEPATLLDRPGTYSRKWAVLIGVGYKQVSFAPRLQAAPGDAIDVASVLLDNYGYQSEHVFLLTDEPSIPAEKSASKARVSAATLDDITTTLNRVLRQTSPTDSLFFYFSGHGSDSGNGAGLLWPEDVIAASARNSSGRLDDPHPSSCLRTDSLLMQLHGCSALHRLLFVDCCHSGAAIDGFEQVGLSGPRSFNAPSTLAICSGSWNEKVPDNASDIRPGHSPMTGALLNVLEQPPVATVGQSTFVPASRLFESVVSEIDEANRRSRLQSSYRRDYPRPHVSAKRVGRATDPQGDFFFFPSRPLQTSTLALQLLPGLRGNWWFTETPWLLPHVRSEMGDIARVCPMDKLRTPVGFVIGDPRNPDVASFTSDLRERVKKYYSTRESQHSRWAMRLMRGDDRRAQAQEILDEVHATPDNQRTSLDWHLIGVLEHFLGQPKVADECLQRAFSLHDETSGLRIQCLLDRMQVLLDSGQAATCITVGEQAGALLRAEQYGTESLDFTHLVLMHLQIQAYRRLDDWTSVNSLAAEAKVLADNLSKPAPAHPLSIYGYERLAWSCMDQMRIEEAVSLFQQALDLRKTLGDASALSQLAECHVRHGLAMAECLKGDRRNAVDQMTSVAESAAKILAASDGVQRMEVLDREINSRERLADFLLSGTTASTSDLERAQVELQHAIKLFDLLLELRGLDRANDVNGEDFVRLASKLSHVQFTLGIATSADMWLKHAQQCQKELPHLTLTTATRIALCLAQTMSGRGQFAPLAQVLREVIDAERLTGRPISRRDREVLLVAADSLLRLDTSASSDDILRRVLQSWRNLQGVDKAQVRRYLRPFADNLIRRLVAKLAPTANEDINDSEAQSVLLNEIVRARSGDVTFTAQRERFTVVVHCYVDGNAIVLAIAPSGRSSEKHPLLKLRTISGKRETPSDTASFVQDVLADAIIKVVPTTESSVALFLEDDYHSLRNGYLPRVPGVVFQPIAVSH